MRQANEGRHEDADVGTGASGGRRTRGAARRACGWRGGATQAGGWVIGAAVAVASCGRVSIELTEGGVDAATARDSAAHADVARVSDAGEVEDAGAGPATPWADGGFALPYGGDITQPPPPACGAAHFVYSYPFYPDAYHACAQGDALLNEAGGSVVRLGLTDLHAEALARWPREGIGARVACQSDALAFAVTDIPSRAGAVIQFADPTQLGAVRWSAQGPPYSVPQAAEHFSEFAATDALLAWVWAQPDTGPVLYVSGPHGEHPRVLPTLSHLPYYLQADGHRLVYVDNSDLWLWDANTPDAPPVNLTNDAADQFYPWLSGDRLVWADERDGGGTLWAPNNPEIYAMDLTTRAITRITHDPPDHPVLQFAPVVSGDWVVWQDYRNASNPNPGEYNVSDRSDLYGYNFTTGREYPVFTGAGRASTPFLTHGAVYFPCTELPPSTRTALFSVLLPTP